MDRFAGQEHIITEGLAHALQLQFIASDHFNSVLGERLRADNSRIVGNRDIDGASRGNHSLLAIDLERSVFAIVFDLLDSEVSLDLGVVSQG